MRVLITGFEPFGHDTENASESVAQALAHRFPPREHAHTGQNNAGSALECISEILPVTFAEAHLVLQAAVEKHQPDFILCLGEAGGRDYLSLEHIGVNEHNARIPDNAGQQPVDSAIIPSGEQCLNPQLPLSVDQLCAVINQHGITAKTSNDAGRFVCNHVSYWLYYWLDLKPEWMTATGGIFVHIPALRSNSIATVGAETDPETPYVASVDPNAPRTIEQCVTGLTLMLEELHRLTTSTTVHS
ncbi:MAG: hypothetical protein Q4A31_02320 [Corynebacterium sp.]|uniref:pyroglutamyl-peptidase I family protein n=1 Tax=Corynebacterium sp. TaxID=1720 RepID=UPI0026DB2EAF|nr:hypothetical protein [Corynebacterium sp.]MDO4760740.1 hypothetical protein [Corynebacterium sp.]